MSVRPRYVDIAVIGVVITALVIAVYASVASIHRCIDSDYEVRLMGAELSQVPDDWYMWEYEIDHENKIINFEERHKLVDIDLDLPPLYAR